MIDMGEWPVIVPARLIVGAIKLDAKRLADLLKNRRDCEVNVVIERLHAVRSMQANRYYFGVVLKAISDYTGYDPNETHEAMKAMFLPKALSFCDGNGEVRGAIVVGGSTRQMNVHEFHDYVDAVRRFAAEQLGLNIPDPSQERAAS